MRRMWVLIIVGVGWGGAWGGGIPGETVKRIPSSAHLSYLQPLVRGFLPEVTQTQDSSPPGRPGGGLAIRSELFHMLTAAHG